MMPMKGLFVFFICILLYSPSTHAFGRKNRYAGVSRTEVELMTKVLTCLKTKDTVSYYNLFPPFDTLWNMVNHSADPSPEAQQELTQLKEHPTVLIDLDPYYNHAIMGRFAYVLGKGQDSGINWKGIVMQRFELQKQGITRGMEGLQRIAPDRFKGYMFVRDMLSSTTYCITITEIQKIKESFFGGQVLNIIAANDIDQYIAKEAYERKNPSQPKKTAEQNKKDAVQNDTKLSKKDSLDGVDVTSDSFIIAKYLEDSAKEANAKKTTANSDDVIPKMPTDTAKIRRDKILLSSPSADDDAKKKRLQVVDRRLYKGKFDDEIPVELYVRYMKDINGKVSGWDGLYKFGDMEKYVKLEITKPEEKWIMEEPVGILELELNGKIYTGSWTSGENQTGYDVELSQKELPEKKIEQFDRILETGTWGKTDKQKIKEKDNAAEKKDGDDKKDKLQNPEKPEKKDSPADTEDDKKAKKEKKKAEKKKNRADDDEVKNKKKEKTEKKDDADKDDDQEKKDPKKEDEEE